ncbi:EamA family transporter [Salaquimonas pukyongi]|uniref:EamA family transporter n=1 Tax=Salaquimonas pukyongi TaxID=2712698 RepID=UPI00096B6CA3|nr:EamA family transporter [Salaquimonas pukyongi]
MEILYEPWVLITLCAAFLQNIRSSLQKHLKGVMGTAGATFVRFGFGVPVAFLLLFLLLQVQGKPLPALSASFAAWVAVAALAQIIAQALLIAVFSYQNFVVGSAYSRTEPIQAALFGLVFLGEFATTGVLIAIAIAMAGVMLMSVAKTRVTPLSLVTGLLSPGAGMGLLSGAFFGLAAVCYRGASLSLEGPGYMIQAAVTLCVAITLQSVLLAAWIAWRNPGEFSAIASAWKPSALVGLVGALASFGWFAAMTLQQASVVKTLAQVEILFTMATSWFVFRERITATELMGVFLVTAGILALLWFG